MFTITHVHKLYHTQHNQHITAHTHTTSNHKQSYTQHTHIHQCHVVMVCHTIISNTTCHITYLCIYYNVGSHHTDHTQCVTQLGHASIVFMNTHIQLSCIGLIKHYGSSNTTILLACTHTIPTHIHWNIVYHTHNS